MMGFGKKGRHPGEIALEGQANLADDSFELARFWVSPCEGRSHVLVGFMEKWQPELLGSLLVESAHTAAAAYAAHTGLSEEEVLSRIWSGFDGERAHLRSEPFEEKK